MARRLAWQFERASQRGEEDAEREDAGEQPFLVDAERGDHFPILRRRAHQHAPARAAEQQPQQPEHERAEPDEQQVISRKGQPEEIHSALEAWRARPKQLAWPPNDQHQVLNDQRDAEGRQQLEKRGAP